MTSNNSWLVVIAGPTAVGKTKLAIELAEYFNTCIINADSRQLYKELKIGTAPPSTEELNKIQHYFVHILSVSDYYNVSRFENDVISKLKELFQTYKLVIMVGGSGLYIDAICKGIDDMPDYEPELRNELLNMLNNNGIEWLRAMLKKLDPDTYHKIDLKNKNRIFRAVEVCLQTGKPYSQFLKNTKKTRFFNILKIALNRNREELYQLINNRVDKMIEQGLIEEAKELYKYRNLTPLKTVGYKELFDYFENKHNLDETIELIKINTRKYARKQLTWFRRDKEFKWFHPDEKQLIIKYIENNIHERIVF